MTEHILTPRLDGASRAELERAVAHLDGLLERPASAAGRLRESGLLERLGAALWRVGGLDAEALREALELAAEEESPLRLTVGGTETQHLPWELLQHPDAEVGFVSRSPWCVLSRRTRGRGEKAPRLSARPLRVLLFVASPEDLDAERNRLDFEREEELLYTALDGPLGRGELDLEVAEDGVLKTLVGRLEAERYHAVILSMHGTEARNREGAPEWGLLFEDGETGRSATVAGSALARALQGLPAGHRPGLVVLSACRSAQAREGTAASIPSVARVLHESGFERVLGMRLSVLDAAASAFSAELFRRVALGQDLGRAVSLARERVAAGDWVGGLKDSGAGLGGDPYGQWSLPVLFERTAGGPLIDTEAPFEPRPAPALSSVLIGDGTIRLPRRESFVGRRMVRRQHLRAFLAGAVRRLLFTGPGGVGKTALAGLFARTLGERAPHTRMLGFRAPFALDETLYEALRAEAFDGTEEASLIEAIQAEPEVRERVRRLLGSLAGRANRPCAFVLDNLESIQDLHTLAALPEHEDSAWFVRTVCALPAPTRVLLTGRYALDELEVDAECHVGEAPYGDVLRRMSRLTWPATLEAQDKRRVYEVLGGNHRAIEWLSQLMSEQPEASGELLTALAGLEAPPETRATAVEVVLEAMRQNLLLDAVRKVLSPAEDRLLRAASHYRVPVNDDGLKVIAENRAHYEAHRERLSAYALLERAYDAAVGLEYFVVPPVVRELLGEARGFEPQALRDLHAAMGRYHRHQGASVTRQWRDDLEAIHHFRAAGEHAQADALAEGVAGFYHRTSSFEDALALTRDIVERDAPPAPWWALNRHGMCEHALGDYARALAMHECALDAAPDEVSRGTTLNNLSQIYDARGDYDTALTYLEQSLAICREIGDKAGEGTTLNNLSLIYDARGDYDTALTYLEQSLAIQRKIGNKAGEGATLNNLATTAHAKGDYDTALTYLEQSLAIRREIGNKAGESTTLNNLSQIFKARGDYDTALTYLEQSLAIQREIGNKAGEGATLNNLSQIYDARGDYDTALTYLEQSLAIRREIGDKAGEGATLNNLSLIYDARGDYDTALTYLEQSLAIQREIGDKAGEGATLNNLSQIFKARGDYDTALTYLEQSLAIRREIGDKAGQIPTLHNMADIALQAEQPARAIELWQEALALAQETGDALGLYHVASSLGQVLAKAGSTEPARELLTLAVAVGNRSNIPGTTDVEQVLRSLPASG